MDVEPGVNAPKTADSSPSAGGGWLEGYGSIFTPHLPAELKNKEPPKLMLYYWFIYILVISFDIVSIHAYDMIAVSILRELTCFV